MNTSERTIERTENADEKSSCAPCRDDSEDSGEIIEIHNVRPVLENRDQLLTLIHTTSSGVSLFARIVDDEFVDWTVRDQFGISLPAVVYQKKQKGGGKKTCRICVTIAGDTNCWEVPCDKIVILPKATGGEEGGGDIEVHDIRGALQNSVLSEGQNEVHTTSSGLRFSAVVEDGEIIDWKVHDASGTELPTTIYQKKPKKPKKPGGEPIKCNVCTTQNGQTSCVEVPCEKIRIIK